MGLIGPAAGRVAERVGWRRLAFAAVACSATGMLLTLSNALPVLVLGLALVAAAMFSGVTAAQLGLGDVVRADRGSATALYFSIYYGAGAVGAYLPGLAWQEWGWGGVAASGFATLAMATACIAVAGPRR